MYQATMYGDSHLGVLRRYETFERRSKNTGSLHRRINALRVRLVLMRPGPRRDIVEGKIFALRKLLDVFEQHG